MKKIIILFIIVFTGNVDAEIKLSANLQNRINKDIAMVSSIKQMEESRGSSGYIGVGADANCAGVNTIQQALDLLPLTGATEIRVARNKIYNENLILDDIDISIVGGYSDCFSMGLPFSDPGNNQSTINGGDSGSVILVQNTTQRRTVSLKNFELVNGSGFLIGSKTTGGGILSNQADALISLTNLDIKNNEAFYGSGISIFNGNTDMLLVNTRIFSNSAKYAGGIYCQGNLSSVVLTDRSGINLNITTGVTGFEVNGNGGGAFMNQCYFALYSGSATGGLVGISGNFASGSGGGIYAMGGSQIIINGHENCSSSGCIGDDDNPASITSNTAGFNSSSGLENGGGIYSIDSNVSIFAGLIAGNTSSRLGGGIDIERGELLIERLKINCWDTNRCNYINNNFASFGGAIYNSSASISISSTYFEDNNAEIGAVIRSLGNNSAPFNTRVEGSIINNNGDANAIAIIQSLGLGNVDLIHTTFADNVTNETIIKSETFIGNISSLEIHASIFDNLFIPVVSHDTPNYTINVSHVISNLTASFSNVTTTNEAENFAGGSYIDFAPLFLDFPLFVDRANRDYHLAENSPAIDYAITTSRATVLFQDIDYEDRARDDPSAEDNYFLSYFDIGADERNGNEIIFNDDFE